ncbi:unnamed protein product [Prorocentrum cordatum]|uniref:Uncharacterized protein n=1 Tax=Prorocentrum cordatum TaxID=2364126 RepID=A0ABN9Y8P9_9DINO|nr:unnamed protein product [Polarella glacialis]
MDATDGAFGFAPALAAAAAHAWPGAWRILGAISELSLKDATDGAFGLAPAPAAAAAHAWRGAWRTLGTISELSLKDATDGAFGLAPAPAAAAAHAWRGAWRTLGTISELSLKDATVGAFAVAFAPAVAAAHARRASGARERYLRAIFEGVPRALVSAISELSLKDATVGAFAVAFAPAAAAAHARRASGARERYLRAIFEGVPRALVSAISELSLKDATVGAPRALVSAISELSLKDATVGAFAVAFAAAAAAAHAGVPRALVSAISELSLKDATVGAFAVAFAAAAAAAHARRASGARERYLRAIFEGVPRALVSAISELSLKDATVGAFAVAFAPAAAAAHARRASGARERYLRAIFEGVPRALVSAISELSLKDATVGAFAVAFAPLRPRPTPGVPRALVSAISELSLKDATVGAFAVAFAPAAAAARAGRASGARERYLRAIFEGVPRALVSAISELSLKDATVGAFAVAFAPAAAAAHARRASGARERYLRAIFEGVPRALVSAISELSLKDATVGAFAVAFAPAAAAAHARRASGARERYLRAIFEGVPRALVSAISELSLKDATVGAFAVAFAAAAAAAHARRASGARHAIPELSLKDATVGAFAVAFAPAAAAAQARRAAGVPRALVSAISELSLKDATVGAFAVAFAPAAAAARAGRASGARERYLRAIFEGVPRALVSAISELYLKDATVGAFAVAFALAAAAAHARRASGARERYLRAIFEGVPRALVSAISELSLKDATVGAFAVALAPLRPPPTPGVPRALVSAISELSLKDATVGAFAVAFAPAAAAPTPGVPRALVSAISELSLKDATVGAFAVAFAPAAAATHARRASGARERYLRAIFEGVPRALVSAISELSLKDATVGAFAVAFAPAAAAAHARRASGARERYLRAIFEGVPRALVSAISELSLKDATVGAFAVAFAPAAAAAHARRASGARERYLRAIFEGVPRALVSAISELSLKDATVGAFAVAFAPAAAAAHARRASGARERYLRAIFEGVPRALVSAISELSLKDATVGAFAVAFAPAAAAAHARRASGARERYLRAIFEGVPRALVSAISELSLKDATVGAFAVAFAPAAAAAHARRASGARERYLRAIFEGVPRALVSAISELSLKDATACLGALVSAISELSLKNATVGAFAVAFAPAAAAAHARRAAGARQRVFEGVPRALVSAISKLSLKDATVGAFAVAFAPAAAAAHARRASGARQRYLRAIFEGVPRALVSAISELSLKDATVGAFAVAFAPAAAAAHARRAAGARQRYLRAIFEGVPRALVSAISELSLKDATVGAFAVAFAAAAAAAHARQTLFQSTMQHGGPKLKYTTWYKVDVARQVQLLRLWQGGGVPAIARQPSSPAELVKLLDADLPRCEYNDILEARDRVCLGCNRKVKLHKPRPGSAAALAQEPPPPASAGQGAAISQGGQGKGKDISKNKAEKLQAAASLDVAELLRMAVKGTQDADLRQVLEAQVKRLGGTATTAPAGPAEALKKAVGLFKDAEHKHTQAAAQVVRLEASLAQARTELKKIKLDLEKLQHVMEGKEAEVSAMLSKAQEMQDRFRKKRKTEPDGTQPSGGSPSSGPGAGKGGSPSPAQGAPPPGAAAADASGSASSDADAARLPAGCDTEDDAELLAAAARLSSARLAAQAQALKEQSANTKGATGKGKGAPARGGKDIAAAAAADDPDLFQRLGALLNSLAVPWLVIGDFNVTPTTLSKSSFMRGLRSEASIMHTNLEATCNVGKRDASHLDYMLVSAEAQPIIASLEPVVSVPWKPHVGLLVRIRRSARALQVRYLDMPRRLPQVTRPRTQPMPGSKSARASRPCRRETCDDVAAFDRTKLLEADGGVEFVAGSAIDTTELDAKQFADELRAEVQEIFGESAGNLSSLRKEHATDEPLVLNSGLAKKVPVTVWLRV